MGHLRFVAGLGAGFGLGVLATFAFHASMAPLADLPDGFPTAVDEYEAQVALVKEVAADPCGTDAVYSRIPFGSGLWTLTNGHLEEGVWIFELAMPVFGEFLTMEQQEALDQYLGTVSYASPGQAEWPASDAHREVGLCGDAQEEVPPDP